MKVDVVLKGQITKVLMNSRDGLPRKTIHEKVNKLRKQRRQRQVCANTIKNYLEKLNAKGDVSIDKSGRIHIFCINENKESLAVPKFKDVFPEDKLRGLYVERKSPMSGRSLAEQIIDEVEEGRDIFVITGQPASGKSTLLRHIGHMLKSTKDRFVYYIGPEVSTPNPEDIRELSGPRTWLLIDEAHRWELTKLNEILITVKGVKIIAVMRDIREQLVGTSYTATIEQLDKAKSIEGSEVSEEIITSFLGKKERSQLSAEIESQLLKNNLIFLSWQLKAYKEVGQVDKEAVSERVREYIQNKLELELKVEGAEDVLLLLSVFSDFEIAVRKDFVESLSNKDVVKKLITLVEIRNVRKNYGDYLELPHSETAKLYLNAFHTFADFGYHVKKNLDRDFPSGWYVGLIQKYFIESMETRMIIFDKIWGREKHIRLSNSTNSLILNKFFQDSDIKNSLLDSIENYYDLCEVDLPPFFDLVTILDIIFLIEGLSDKFLREVFEHLIKQIKRDDFVILHMPKFLSKEGGKIIFPEKYKIFTDLFKNDKEIWDVALKTYIKLSLKGFTPVLDTISEALALAYEFEKKEVWESIKADLTISKICESIEERIDRCAYKLDFYWTNAGPLVEFFYFLDIKERNHVFQSIKNDKKIALLDIMERYVKSKQNSLSEYKSNMLNNSLSDTPNEEFLTRIQISDYIPKKVSSMELELKELKRIYANFNHGVNSLMEQELKRIDEDLSQIDSNR